MPRPLIPLFVLSLALAPAAASAETFQSATQPLTHPASRTDVLSGHASRAQTVEHLQASIEAAGGRRVDAASEASSDAGVLGGYAYPILALDLDGDGDDEVLLEQFTNRDYLVALDDGEILWRQREPKKSYLIGVLPGDLFESAGEEVLFVAFKWNTGDVVLKGAGASGLRWASSFPGENAELDGLVQADADDQDEIALSVRDEDSWAPRIDTYDGETGIQISSVEPSLAGILGDSSSAQGFVTDGPQDASDEAVFLYPLGQGYYAERLSLTDGKQTDFNLVPVADVNDPQIGQGLDFTGDGLRDGYILDFLISDDSSSLRVGVFDGGALELAWMKEIPGPSFFWGDIPFAVGDADGDGGQDLCQSTHDDEWDEETDRTLSSTSSFTCFSGDTGTQLWTASRSITAPDEGYVHTSGWVHPDLNGDGALDPILDEYSIRCVENADGWHDCDAHYAATSHSGRGGTAIWNVSLPDAWTLGFDLTDSNLDGVAGDDGVEQVWGNGPPNETRFAIINGLSLQPAWQGSLVTGNLEDSYIDGAIDADLDGDGSVEAVVLADAYQGIGEPYCEVFEDEEYCWYEDYEEHAFAAGFEPGGQELWHLEL